MRGEQPLDVSLDGKVRVGDGGGLQRCLGQAGRLGGSVPEAGVGEKAGSALGVVNDRDFKSLSSAPWPPKSCPAR